MKHTSDKEVTYYNGGKDEMTEPALGQSTLMKTRKRMTADSQKIIFIMVGLPGRGKSYIARKLAAFLNWKGYRAKIFNVGKYRRSTPKGESARADYFDPLNVEAVALREQHALMALEDVFTYLLKEEGDMAIFDATNSTRNRRQTLRSLIRNRDSSIGIIQIESICTDKEVLRINMMNKISSSPDYEDMNIDDAIKDFQSRTEKYESSYEEYCHDESYIQLFDLSSKVLAHHVYGKVTKSLLSFLMSLHVGSRSIYLTRAAIREESIDKLSLVAPLSEEGKEFANNLMKWVIDKFGCMEKGSVIRLHDGRLLESPLGIKIMTSTLPWAIETSQYIDAPYEEYGCLNPLDKGVYTGLTLEEIKIKDPDFMKKWECNSFQTRFPGGESYFDLVSRLENTIVDIEQQTCPVLLIGHRTVLQVLYCYLASVDIHNVADIIIPHGVVLEFAPSKGGSWIERRHYVGDGSGVTEMRSNKSNIHLRADSLYS